MLTMCPAQGQPAPLAPIKATSSGAELTFNIFLWGKQKKKKLLSFWQILNPLKYVNLCYKPERVLQYKLNGAVFLSMLTLPLVKLPILCLFAPRFSKVHAVFKGNSLNCPEVSGVRAGADG